MNKVVLSTIEILIQVFAIVVPAWIYLRNYKDKDIDIVAVTSYFIGVLTTSITIIMFGIVDIWR